VIARSKKHSNACPGYFRPHPAGTLHFKLYFFRFGIFFVHFGNTYPINAAGLPYFRKNFDGGKIK
jgi:hypothetical protein